MSPKEPAVWPPEGYVPVVARTPEALKDERKAREAAEFEERVRATAEELGVTLKEARQIVAGL